MLLLLLVPLLMLQAVQVTMLLHLIPHHSKTLYFRAAAAIGSQLLINFQTHSTESVSMSFGAPPSSPSCIQK
jgi:hypothetical protein